MPRSYDLGQRTAPKAATRARIVAAALEIYRDRGLAGASNLAVARAADVAPATIRNHFPGSTDLAKAVLEALLGQLEIPTPALFDGASSLRDHIDALAFALATFYERSEPWWRAYEREPDLAGAWSGGVDQYDADVERLIRAALGELAHDETAVAVVASVVGPPTFFALRARGLSSDEAAHVSVELVVSWLERRGDGITPVTFGMVSPDRPAHPPGPDRSPDESLRRRRRELIIL